MKALIIRHRLLVRLFNDINDFDNFKCIITSRSGYIDSSQFHNVLELKKFDIKRVEDFVKIITGGVLKKGERIEPNLEVLGIPVVLYMAVMSNVDISENPTKAELYNRIFAEKGGIFDKFSCDGVGYDKGAQVLRNGENIKIYLSFLQKVAFVMFENNSLSLKMDDCNVPELEFQGDKVSVLEFPIKHLFENTEANIEFIHASIYEYFVSEYIFCSISRMIKKDNFKKEDLVGVMGRLFKFRNLSSEIIEFLAYKVRNSLNDKFGIVNDAFNLMLKDGMTYYTGERYRNIIDCELRVFANMFEILHLWENKKLIYNRNICNYLNCNGRPNLNLNKMTSVVLHEVYLRKVHLKGAYLREANLEGAYLEGAYLEGAYRRSAFRESTFRRNGLKESGLKCVNMV